MRRCSCYQRFRALGRVFDFGPFVVFSPPGAARRVTELRALFTLFTKDWSLTRDCNGNLWSDCLLGGSGPSLTPDQKVLVVGIRMRQLRVKHEFRTDDSEAFMKLRD